MADQTTGRVVIRNKDDVFELINQERAVNRQAVLIGLIALGGTFVDAYDFTSLGIGAVQLKTQFHLTSTSLGSLTASMAVGALVGALVGGYYADRIGRLKMFLLDLALFVVSAIAAALAPNLGFLIVFRLLMGLGVGLDFPVALSFVAEFASIRRKSRFVNGWQVMWYSAATIGFLLLLGIHVAGVIGATQSMEYFALGFYLPTIIGLLFGKDLSTVLWASALFNAFGIVGALINLATTNRLGIRRMAIIGYSGVIVAMAVIGVFGHGAPATLTAVLLIAFIGFHSFGQGTAGMSMGALSYPTAIRGIGAGFTQSVIRVGSIFGFYFFPLVLGAVGLYHTTLILMAVPIIGLTTTLIIRWDPTGKDIEAEEDDPPALAVDGRLPGSALPLKEA
jgi:MFS family permease